MPYNLASPNELIKPPDLHNLMEWYSAETQLVRSESIRRVLKEVGNCLEEFVQWPARPLLLWKGCNRVPEGGNKSKYHRYTDSIKSRARGESVYLDSRPNGPAIAAFCLAGGKRPSRFGSSNQCSIHHVYSGKFPHPLHFGVDSPTHAAKKGHHFTQSAGLVAVHPIADALADEFPFFTWFLRAKAFERFKYDPDGVFSGPVNEFGFADGVTPEIIEMGESVPSSPIHS